MLPVAVAGLTVACWGWPQVAAWRLELALQPAALHDALAETAHAGVWPLGRVGAGDLFDTIVVPLLAFPWLPGGLVHAAIAVGYLATVGRQVGRWLGGFVAVAVWSAGGVAAGVIEALLHADATTPRAGVGAGVTAVVSAAVVLGPRTGVPVLLPPAVVHVPLWAATTAWLVLQVAPVQRVAAPRELAVLGWPAILVAAATGAALGVLLSWRRPRG